MVNPRSFLWRPLAGACVFAVGFCAAASAQSEARPQAAERFHREIEPLLTKYCYDCHGEGKRKGKVAFDEFSSDADILSQTHLWSAALKNVRTSWPFSSNCIKRDTMCVMRAAIICRRWD